MDQQLQGKVVAGPEGRIGIVKEVLTDDGNGPSRLVVASDDGDTLLLAPDSYHLDGDVVRLLASTTSAGMTTQPTGISHDYSTRRIPDGEVREITDDQVVIPVVREEVHVERRAVERGGVRVNKFVDERQETVEQPVFHEEVNVERVPIGRAVEQVPEVREEGDTLIIPVVEEMLVVEKRLVLKEEVRVTRRRIEETEQAQVVLRAERVEVEEIPAPLNERIVGDDSVK